MRWEVVQVDGRYIVRDIVSGAVVCSSMHKGEASLIAAAPELLERLNHEHGHELHKRLCPSCHSCALLSRIEGTATPPGTDSK